MKHKSAQAPNEYIDLKLRHVFWNFTMLFVSPFFNNLNRENSPNHKFALKMILWNLFEVIVEFVNEPLYLALRDIYFCDLPKTF